MGRSEERRRACVCECVIWRTTQVIDRLVGLVGRHAGRHRGREAERQGGIEIGELRMGSDRLE